MAMNLPAMTGYKKKPKEDELAVSGKDDILNRKENERMKRRQRLLDAWNKGVKYTEEMKSKMYDLAKFVKENGAWNKGKPMPRVVVDAAIAYNTGRPIYLPDEVLWRQKEQFSDSVTYRWIDTLKQFTNDEISSKHSIAFKNKGFLYPFNTPSTPEAFYYRQIFDVLFPGREKTVKLWVPNTRWKGVNADPSGRAQIVHEKRYDYVKDNA